MNYHGKVSMRKLNLIFLIFLFIIPVTLADMSVNSLEKIYNLGEKIIPSVSIKEDKNYSGFFKASVLCNSYEQQYYIVPLNIEAESRTEVGVAGLTAFNSMIGNCRISAEFQTMSGEKIASKSSENFQVTDELKIELNENLEAKPGETVLVSGEIKKYNDKPLQKANLEIMLKEETDNIEVVLGKFEHEISLGKNELTGTLPAIIVAKDEHGNYKDQLIKIRVLPIPTRLENNFDKDILKPKENIKVRITLYDHNDYVVDGTEINVKIYGPDEKLILEKEIGSLTYLEFETKQNQMPGAYKIISSFENIKEENTFTIEELKRISMNRRENFIDIANTGNVDYNDETTIILEKEGKNYLINKKISLKPLESTSIDISKEVPDGNYKITLPEEAAQNNVIEDVFVEDNRNIVKKTMGGLSAITGAAVETANYVASRPTLASIILIVIVIATVAYYSKGFIIEKIKGEDKEKTDHLFEDFDYKEK